MSQPRFIAGFTPDLIDVFLGRMMPGTTAAHALQEMLDKFSHGIPTFWGCRTEHDLVMMKYDPNADDQHVGIFLRKDARKVFKEQVPWLEIAPYMIEQAFGGTTVVENAPDLPSKEMFDKMIELFIERICKRLPAADWELSFETIRLWYKATLESEQERERDNHPVIGVAVDPAHPGQHLTVSLNSAGLAVASGPVLNHNASYYGISST